MEPEKPAIQSEHLAKVQTLPSLLGRKEYDLEILQILKDIQSPLCGITSFYKYLRN